jgi:hypothetical protein
MQFALLIYQDWNWLEELRANTELAELGEQIAKEYGEVTSVQGLTQNVPFGSPKDAITVRVQNGKTVTSDGTVGGPNASAGSIYLFEAEDKAAAIDFASRIPAARFGGAIEIRQVGQYW